jgi:hypothetical protein
METQMNLCRACDQDFSSVLLFDRHRVGKHEYTYHEGLKFEPPVEDGRRCLTVAEMTDKGWERDRRGRWSDPKEVARTRQGFSAKRTEASAEEASVVPGQMSLPGTDNPTISSP